MNVGLDISMFGSPGIALAGDPVTGFVSAKAQALVFYLAATGETHRRSHLAGLLWSDVEEERARKNLRDVLSNLRQRLGPALEITRQTAAIAAGAPVVVDTAAFEEALRAGDPASLARAASLYRGDFLAGFYLSGAPLFEEWALGLREHYRLLALQTLSELAGFYGEQGQSLRAIDALTQLLAADPWREEGHRKLMTLLANAGDTSAAIAQYQRMRTVLADEMGAEPEAETVALYERIRRGKTPAAPAAAPSTTAAPSPPVANNVPAPTHPFVGRGQEVDHILSSIGDPACRLLTIVGQGGMGKTKLALHCLRGFLAGPASRRFRDGVFVVPLQAWTGANQPAELASAISEALGLVASEPVPVDRLVLDHLRPRQILLLLDSFEHLRGARAWVAEMLAAAPGLLVLVTSRHKLGVVGERLLTLHGLPVPAGTRGSPTLQNFPALQLFQQQAVAVAPEYVLDDASLPAVTRICRSVQGLPLGVMLAAALVRYLSLEEIAGELERDIRFVDEATGGEGRGLRTVFERSWQLLEPDVRQSLVRLVAFRGGFTRAAAAQLAGASLSILAELMDASFLRRLPGAGTETSRYEVVGVLSAFVAERSSPAEAEQLHAEHCCHFAAWLDELADELQGRGQRQAVEAITNDLDNVRAAWDWAVAHRDGAALDRAALGLFRYYEMRSLFREGAERFVAAAAALDSPDARIAGGLATTRTRLRARGGWFVFQLGRAEEARAWLEQGVATFRKKEHRQEQIFCLNYLAAALSYTGDYAAARGHSEAALRLARQCANVHGVVTAQNILSQIAYAEGQFDRARRLAQISLAMDRERGNNWSAAFSLVNVGRAMLALGEFGSAGASFQEAIRLRKAIGDARGIGHCLNLLGDAAAVQGETSTAQHRYAEALRLFEGIHNLHGAGESLLRLGRLALARDDLTGAETYLLDALRRASAVGARPLQLAVLAEVATLRWRRGAPDAADVARLVLAHPATRGASRLRLDWFTGAGERAEDFSAEDSLDVLVAEVLAAANPAAVV